MFFKSKEESRILLIEHLHLARIYSTTFMFFLTFWFLAMEQKISAYREPGQASRYFKHVISCSPHDSSVMLVQTAGSLQNHRSQSYKNFSQMIDRQTDR